MFIQEKNTRPLFQPFLKMVADDLIYKYGNDLSKYVVVFPNKRARLFLNDYFANHGIVWTPRYVTISELFCSLSDVVLNDPIDTICRIYDIYKKTTKSNETLDSFYGWGEKLLSDFDDVDKNLAEAQKLFTNVKDYKTIDFGEFLTEDEKKVIECFFGNFNEKDKSQVKENFLLLWNHMFLIYQKLNKNLLSEGLAYEGALYRRVVERIESGGINLQKLNETKKWIFVGFNVLDAVEHRLMTILKNFDRALFYWDYDEFYVTKDNTYEAGEFIGKNLKEFPNELQHELFKVMGKGQEFEFVAAPTENAQAFSATRWIQKNLSEDPKRTAIVICNENLLEPVLHALPSEVNQINITKGFPLSHTTAYTKLIKLIDDAEKNNQELPDLDFFSSLQMHIREYARDSEQNFSKECDIESFQKDVLRELNAEACFRIYTILERLSNIATKDYFKLSRHTLRKLIIQIVRQTNIPFHGEPAVGLQIMGVLETRNLDFENIMILSANEGMIPKVNNDNSFIPYPIKKAFGLTLINKKNAVYAYYFFRLIQRAKKVRFVYNNTSNALQTGEMSRYMMQLLLSQRFNIKHYTLSALSNGILPRRLEISKPADILERLKYNSSNIGQNRQETLSPSSLNCYLDCPLKFYFHRIAKLKKPHDEEKVIDDSDFGTLFHGVAELYYRKALERNETDIKSYNEKILNEKDNATLRKYIAEAYKNINCPRDVIAEETVLGYLKKLLKADSELGDLRIIELETDRYINVPITIGDKTEEIRIGGIIDRIDVATNPHEPNPYKARTLRIVDYKTGNRVHEAKTLDDIFHKKSKRPYHIFQTFLYALTVEDIVKKICGEDIPVSTVLFYPSQYGKKEYSPWVKFSGETLNFFPKELRNDFYNLLQKTLEEIFNPEIPFVATDNEKSCEHCDFRILCNKREKKC